MIATLPFPKKRGMEHAKDYVTDQTLILEQWMIPAKTIIKLINGENFGYAILPEHCQDIRGFEIPRRIFRY